MNDYSGNTTGSGIKSKFIDDLPKLECIEGFRWELIGREHTKYIVKWRNSPSNIELFESKTRITEESQTNFINNYNSLDRVDLLLVGKEPIGVFSIKNLQEFPEYGALIGNVKYRKKGISSKAKRIIFNYWFKELAMEVIYLKNRFENQFLIDANIRLGFKKVETLKNDLVVLRLTKEDYFEFTEK